MRAWLTEKFGPWPRCPLAGVALAAVAGISSAEGWRWRFVSGFEDAGLAPWIATAAFLLLAAGWARRQRTGWLWSAVAAGYAALHLLATDPTAALTLARVLSSPTGAVATGNDPGHPTAHILHATGTVVGLPRLVPPPVGFPVPRAGPTWRFTLRLESADVDGLGWPCHAAVSARWQDAVSKVSAGDRLEITALAENAASPRNPGESDYAGYLRRQGILSEVRIAGVADGRVLPALPGAGDLFSLNPLRRMAGRLHDWVASALRLDLSDDPEAAAVVATELLGLSDPPGLGDLESVFQRTGTLHYFAVDGLKLGLISFLLLRALCSFGLSRPWPGVVVLPLLLGYVFATGLSVAGLRALVFAFVLIGGELSDRPSRPLNSLGASAAAVLLFDSQALFSLGFQLTFTNMLVILLVARGLNARLQRLGAPDPFLPRPLYSRSLRAWDRARREICKVTALSVAAWLGSLPIMLLSFHLFSPVSLLANVVTFPLAFCGLTLGVLSVASAGFSTALATWFNNANWLCAKTFLGLVRVFDAVPGGSLAVSSPAHWHWPAPAAELTVYDFDRGRAAALRAGSSDWLIDSARLSEYALGVLPCLRAHATGRLSGGLILTQADADHLAAARLAVSDLHPAQIIESARANRSPLLRDFRGSLVSRRQTETFCRLGNILELGADTRATVLYPPDDLSGKFRAAADRALVLRVDAAGWRVLLLTEGSGAAARWLVEHAAPAAVASDVLITSGPVAADLFAAVQPRLVVLRPAIVKASALGKAVTPTDTGANPDGIPTLAQRDCGAVTLLIYPGRLEAGGFVNGRRVSLEKQSSKQR